MPTIYDLLTGTDLRSIGKSNEVVQLVTSDPVLFDEVFDGIFHKDKVIRARCADAAEKVGRMFPKYIQKKKMIILKNLQKFEQKEVRWHIAMMLGYIKLTPKEIATVSQYLFKWLSEEKSIIVKVMCMQALADLALKNKKMLKSVRDEIEKQMINGAPAIKARGRHLLKQFEKLK
ncbi:MAG: hypothetical protein M1495_12580 [Bacteroidetes bacterium]|nr:hypothetical protein [Bacteroidota bacterium]MCL6100715.1 hypothetical protein [Bacteroidota bacterium]